MKIWYSTNFKETTVLYFWGRVDIDTLHTDSHFKGYKLLNM